MAYTINANAKNVWIRDNEDTRDLSIQTDASSVYLENGRTLEQELGEGSMVSNVATVNNSMSKVIDGTLDGAYESGVMYGRSLVNVLDKKKLLIGQNTTLEDDGSITAIANGGYYNLYFSDNGTIKENSEYLLIYEVVENTLDVDFYVNGGYSTNGLYENFIVGGVIVPPSTTGYFVKKVQTRSKAECINNFKVLRTFISTGATVGRKIKYRVQLIEYQEGMEDWSIPFFEGLCDVKMPILRNVGANLFDINQSYDHAYGLPEKYFVENNKLHFINVETHRNLCWWVKVNKGERIYCSCLEENNKGKIDVRFFSEKRVGDDFINRNSWQCNGTINSTICSDEWMLLMLNTSTDSGDFVFANINVSYHGTGYEDYKTNILHTPETVTLRSLPNGVRDELNLKTGEYIKRIGEVTLDGSENWKAWESNDTHCKLSLANYPPNMRINGQHTTRLVCDKLKIGNDRVGVVNDNFMASVGDVAYTIIVGLELGKLTSADVAGFKQWLKENPLTVQYELAEPITTKVTLAQSEPIVKIGTELPNGVCDTYNLLTGEHIQRVGKVVLDGSEVWKNGSLTSNDGQYYVSYCPLSSMKKYTIASGVISLTSDKFIAEPPVGDDEAKRRNREFIASYGSNATVVDGESNWIYLSVEKRKIANNTGIAFADYLKSNPVTVWYELKTPIVTKKNGLPNTYGITLPNGVVDKYNESTRMYTQNIGKVVLDGNENWFLGMPETTNNITFGHDITWGKVGHCVSSDRFETQYISSTNSNPVEDKESIICGNRFSAVAGRINITIAKSKLSSPTIEGFRQWLSQNPTTVYHELATPVETPVYQINVGEVLPNGVCDTYNPVTKEYTQNIKKMVLNGDDSVTYLWETFSNPAEDTVAISITNLSDVVNGSGQITSDKIPFGTSSMDDVESILYNHDNRKITIEILKSRLTELNLAGFKKWLQKNPLTVWYQLATPVISKVDVNMETLYVGHPIAYENGHVILESGHDGQSLLPTLEYSTVTNRVKQIESIGEQVLRQEKQLTMLEQMLIQNIIGLDYNNTVLALNLEINEVM